MKQKDFNIHFVHSVTHKKNEINEQLFNQIKDGPRLSAINALRVYQEDYTARLSEALRNTYKGIYAILGDHDFDVLAKDYIVAHCSTSPDLNNYGEQLSIFITTHPLIDDYIFLSELANFEWNFQEIFHTEQIIGLSADEITLSFSRTNELVNLVNSARVLEYNYLITEIYKLKDTDSEPTPFEYDKTEMILMHKEGDKVKTQLITRSQLRILQKLKTSSALQNIFSQLDSQIIPEEIQQLFTVFGKYRLITKSD